MGQDEVFDVGATPSQLSMFKLMADPMVMASEKAEKRNLRPPPSAPVDGVPVSFLKKNHVCINFNTGRCQDSGPHRHPFILEMLLHHQCGACKYAGTTDTSHSSREVDRCPNKQVFRRK